MGTESKKIILSLLPFRVIGRGLSDAHQLGDCPGEHGSGDQELTPDSAVDPTPMGGAVVMIADFASAGEDESDAADHEQDEACHKSYDNGHVFAPSFLFFCSWVSFFFSHSSLLPSTDNLLG